MRHALFLPGVFPVSAFLEPTPSCLRQRTVAVRLLHALFAEPAEEFADKRLESKDSSACMHNKHPRQPATCLFFSQTKLL